MISEARLCAGRLQRRDWGEGVSKPGLTICLMELRVAENICRTMQDLVVLLSLHALGRWFQRSLDNSETALLADLAALGASYGAMLSEHERTLDPRFRVQVAGGAWVGEVNRRYSEATLQESGLRRWRRSCRRGDARIVVGLNRCRVGKALGPPWWFRQVDETRKGPTTF